MTIEHFTATGTIEHPCAIEADLLQRARLGHFLVMRFDEVRVGVLGAYINAARHHEVRYGDRVEALIGYCDEAGLFVQQVLKLTPKDGGEARIPTIYNYTTEYKML